MKRKINQSLLNEELKKFKLLSEYSFYTEDKDDDLILGSNLDEANEDPEAPADDAGAAPATPAAPAAPADAQGNQGMFGMGDMSDAGTEAPADDAGAAPAADTGAVTPDTGAETGTAPMEPVAPAEDEEEVDVTQIVQGTDDAKEAAEEASSKTDDLMAKFDELERRISNMDKINHKIEDLEKEIVKRNPTPVEKLEMRSMDSYPYNIKLTDYWKNIDGYDIDQDDKEPKEYTLTQDEVDTGYTDSSIKQSFNVPEDYEDYDEEEI